MNSKRITDETRGRTIADYELLVGEVGLRMDEMIALDE
jgi:hypothetical protein